MHRALIWLLAALPLAAQSNAEIRAAFEALATEHAALVKLVEIPNAVPGQYAVSLGDTKAGLRPALLVLGSLRGDEATPAIACLELARAVLADEEWRTLLDAAEVIIIPVPNPLGREWLSGKPALAMPGAALPFDDDRDGKMDEDGPGDINDDGVVTQMRVKRAGGKFVLSKNDARIMLPVKPGQVGEYDIFWEGVDSDGDGRVNEDAPGTITLSNDWSIRWAEGPTANRFMMQQRETRALADFILARTNIVAAFQLRGVGGKVEFAKGPPRRGGENPFARDGEVAAVLAKAFGDGKSVVPAASEGAGNVLDWLYESQGMLAANVHLVAIKGRPEAPGPEDENDQPKDKDEDGEEDAPEAPGDQPAPRRERNAPQVPEAAWLEYAPERWHEWKAFSHPQLGNVEIGGWELGAYSDCKPEDAKVAVPQLVALVKATMQSMPRLSADTVEVEDKGGGVYRVRLTLHNAGAMDYRSAFAERNRIGLPIFVELKDTAAVKLVSGTRRVEHENLHGGAKATFEWLVRSSDAAAQLQIEVQSSRTGNFTHKAAINECPKIRAEDE
jgi:hypothetical protein